MTDIDKLVERILALSRDPSLRTGLGSQFPVLETYPPVDRETIASAESILGFELPELLRQCYLRVGNGGFGPEHGIIGLEDGYPDDLSGGCLPQLYQYYREETEEAEETEDPWPPGLLPVFVVGCGLVDSIDCSAPGYPIVRMDNGLKRTEISLYDWMEQWVIEMERKRTSAPDSR
ncbi:MAG: SMI1/KNR4 family protein [Bryobacteraceae bacterium]